ncbi:MAG: cytochrome c maturation protein CcmE [Anaerolineales bacterium]|nr:cytochrome c maturation protein CcmE [Anaerolineales bacterium]MCB9127137.1 cytochrome c maturation protein CcmE [Ardenticatenales bacterium]MCB9171897.1 cytochrome c maturation protein CcmE [Ardenticatenales bacterium]
MKTISSQSKPKSSKTKFWAGGAIILVALIALIYNGLQMGGAYYLTMDELAAKERSMVGQGVRLNAVVDKESVNYDTRAIALNFDLVDPNSGARRSVSYHQPMPDLFMKSDSVIVEGTVLADGSLDAHNIIVKCPSKYEEKQDNGEEIPEDHANDAVMVQ